MVSQRAHIVLDTVVELSELFRVPLILKRISISRAVAQSKGGPYLSSKIVTEIHTIDKEVGGGHVYLKMKRLVSVRL